MGFIGISMIAGADYKLRFDVFDSAPGCSLSRATRIADALPAFRVYKFSNIENLGKGNTIKMRLPSRVDGRG
jgi:hypothetical protein